MCLFLVFRRTSKSNVDTEETNTTNTTDWDDSKSYSSISILKEYDLNSLDDDAADPSEPNLEARNLSKKSERNEIDEDDLDEAEHCSLSTGELSSSSVSSIEASKRRHCKKPPPPLKQGSVFPKMMIKKTVAPSFLLTTTGLLSPVVHSIMRERSEEQVQLNFTMQISVQHLNFNFLSQNEIVTFSLDKMASNLDINNVYQKFNFRLKEFEIYNKRREEKSVNDRVIFTSNTKLLNKNVYLQSTQKKESMAKPVSSQNNQTSIGFIDLTFTRALISNFNKRYAEINNQTTPSNNKKKGPKTATPFKQNQAENKSFNRAMKSNTKWISELNITVNDFDILFHMRKLNVMVEFYFEFNKYLDKHLAAKSITSSDDSSFAAELGGASSKNSVLIPLITPNDVPLVNIEIGRVRFVCLSQNASETSYDLFVCQFLSFNLTSSVEYPIVRNFLFNSTASNKLYKYKANGMLYRPGFAFEDRQYLLEVKNLAVFKSQSKCLCDSSDSAANNSSFVQALVNSFSIRSVLGLPMLYKNRLINGYVLECSVLTSSLEFFLGTSSVKLMLDIARENTEWIREAGEKFTSTNAQHTVNNLQTNYATNDRRTSRSLNYNISKNFIFFSVSIIRQVY